MFIGELLKPTNDYVFKRLFGYVGNEEITKGLLSSIIKDAEINSVKLDCKEILEQDVLSDKFGILDIRAILNNNIQCNIEMQIIDKKDIENRLLFYWSRLYAKSIKLGANYIDAQRTIIILFADYNIKNLENINKYITKWHICEDNFKETVLTMNFEIYIIELPKFEKYVDNSEIDTWVKFLKNPEVIGMSEINENEALKNAKTILEEISKDEYEQELAFKRELYLMDKKAIEAAGFDKGLEQGIKEGIKEGIKQGIEQGVNKGKNIEKIEIAKKLLIKGYSIEEIIEITGLTKEDIEKLDN